MERGGEWREVVEGEGAREWREGLRLGRLAALAAHSLWQYVILELHRVGDPE